MGFKGMRIAITGASRGLGKGMGERFLALGHHVAFFARSLEKFESDNQLRRVGDVTDASSLNSFYNACIAKFGGLDLWINNAGVLNPIKPLRTLQLDELRGHFAVNIEGVLLGSQCFINHCRQTQTEGVLVNISSGAAQKGYHGWGPYCAAKAAVDRMTECIALEEAEIGLKALSVAPGIVDTDMQSLIRSTPEKNFPSRAKFVSLKELERFNSPEFVADTLLGWVSALHQNQTLDVCLRVPDQHA